MTLHAEAIERKQIGAPLTADGLLRRRASQRPGVDRALRSSQSGGAWLRRAEDLVLSRGGRGGRCARLLLHRAWARARRHDRGAASQSRSGAADPACRLARGPDGRRRADAVAGGRNRQGLRAGRAEGPDRRVVLRRRETRRDALRGSRLAAVGALRARLRPRSAGRRCLARCGDCRRADGAGAPHGVPAAHHAGHDHLHRARRRAARGDCPPRGGAFRPRRDDRAVALARHPRRDPQSLSLDRARGAFARADGVAGRRGHAGSAHAVRLSAFRPAAARQRRNDDGGASAHPGRAGQGRRAAPSPLAGCGGSARCGRCPSLPHPRRRPSTARHRFCSMSIRSAISRASCFAARRARG